MRSHNYLIHWHLYQLFMNLMNYFIILQEHLLWHLHSIMQLHNLLLDHFNYLRLIDILNSFRPRHIPNNIIIDHPLNHNFSNDQFLDFIDDYFFLFSIYFFKNSLFNDMFSDHWFFNIEWHFFCNNKWNLNLNGLNFSLTNIITLVLNTISVSRHRYFTNNLERNTLLDLHLNYPVFVNNTLYYLLYLHYLNILLILDYYLLHDHLHWLLNLLDYYLGNEYLDYLQNGLLNYNYSLYYLGHLHYLLNNSRNHHNLLYNSLYLHNPRHLHNFLDYPLLNLLFYPNNFLLNNDGNWFIHMYLLHNFLLHWYQLNLLNFQFPNSLLDIGHRDFLYNWNLLSNIKRHYLLNLRIFSNHNLMNDRFINEYLHLFNNFHRISFDKMRTFNEYLLGDLLI